MASKKELVEGQSFSRRRLVTAFVSGAPGGREVEPGKPLRAVVGGIVLSAVLVVGALAVGLLSPTLPDGWDNNSLVIAKDTGARYVALNGTLHPVINTASARLLIPNGFKVVSADASKLTKAPRGATVGIIGAPDALPSSSSLVSDAWTSCTGQQRGLVTRIGTSTAKAVTDTAVVVTVTTGQTRQTFMIDNGLRFELPIESTPRTLNLDSQAEYDVSASWVNLFTEGAPIQPFDVPGAGTSLAGVNGLPSNAVVGSIVISGGDKSRPYLLERGGSIAPLTPFATAIYLDATGRAPVPTINLDQASFARLGKGDDLAPASWPAALPASIQQTPCAMLKSGKNGTTPAVALGLADETPPTGDATTVNLDPGTGALVRGTAAGQADVGSVYLVDQTGTAFPVQANGDDPIQRLGYSLDDIVPVPQSWVTLLQSGPTLSVAAAQSTVSARTGG